MGNGALHGKRIDQTVKTVAHHSDQRQTQNSRLRNQISFGSAAALDQESTGQHHTYSKQQQPRIGLTEDCPANEND